MLQGVPSALQRALNARFSGPSTSTRALGLLVTRGVPHGCSVNTTSTPRKTYGSIQLLRPRSSSAVEHDVVRRRQKRTVNNLDPTRLNMSDIIDLNGSTQLYPFFGASRSRIVYSNAARSTTPFPPHARGFFYYHSRPGLPTGTGEIRFRVVDSRSASHSAAYLFANGRDLLDRTGHKPWRIHMLQIYSTRNYDPIRRILLSQGLIDLARDREAEQKFSVAGFERVGKSIILDTISDAFVIQLPIMTLCLAFIHDECIVPASQVAYKLHWRDRHENVEGSDARWREYQGAAVVRYELKKAEMNKMFHGAKQGEVVLVLRILELLDPAGPDEVPFRLPEGGDLAQGGSPSFYWFMPLDTARKQGIITPSSLKILEELYLNDKASTETTPTKGHS
ncbi:hypothetical protein DFP72DRAFT_1169724 [Ephemerocybe angulata]|uniref:Uncharacterized protein n=1 Tax=Ephemerocybe angulata TaxID=980116 RepID=A0A8H6M5H7_9AGAR|nr:hypothetical protein DFP72DRAFT_1169724 [Tulosesus angulatus]